MQGRISLDEVKKRLRTMFKVEITYTPFDENEAQFAGHILDASKNIEKAFLKQVDPRNLELRAHLSDSENPDCKIFLEYFDWQKGPWDRSHEDEPFIGTEKRSLGAGYYPEDMDKEEFEEWIEAHPKDKDAFTGYYSVIRRDGKGLISVPYSVEYKEFLEAASNSLKKAANLTGNASLKKFLLSRADSFLSDNYTQSEFDWMDMDSRIELTIGPYDFYEDKLFGYKTAFQSFITIKDFDESKKLQPFMARMGAIDDGLPMRTQFKVTRKCHTYSVSVADVIYAAGDANAGRATSALNLPNDDCITELRGTKQVLLRNVMKAGFDNITKPSSQVVIEENQQPNVTFRRIFMEYTFMKCSMAWEPPK